MLLFALTRRVSVVALSITDCFTSVRIFSRRSLPTETKLFQRIKIVLNVGSVLRSECRQRTMRSDEVGHIGREYGS
jgi:hypothetical protein